MLALACFISQFHIGGHKYGYARFSTDDQDPALQLAALKKASCRQTFTDHGISGATTKYPALARCLNGQWIHPAWCRAGAEHLELVPTLRAQEPFRHLATR
jgi:hypothetical protein